ncbi:MAG: thiamine pyrophosphate-binding protein [Candidatus Latescibacterota bacterium]|nr:thiamine pyrophosphate-binding protein [Candidatus Latescibacterota bacterium]
MNGADTFTAALRAHDVEWVSTLCGHGLNEVYAACERTGLRIVDTRNEQTASYMAECWGRLSGKVGVCAVSSGVAHANALSGIANAYFDGAPMLLVTGSGPLSTAGKGHFQDFDQVALVQSVCKYARTIDVAERIPEIVHEAMATAVSGRPGPVHLTFPTDMQEQMVADSTPPSPQPDKARPILPSDDAVRQAARLLARSERPLMITGSGVFYASAGKAVADFAAAYAVPFAIPIWDRGCVAQPLPEYLGVVGAASGGPRLLEDADLILLLGAAADYRVSYMQAPAIDVQTQVIRVDVDPDRLHHMGRATLSVLADPAMFLQRLIDVCAKEQIEGFEDWLHETQRRKEEFSAAIRTSGHGGLDALQLCAALDEALPEDAVVVIDGGNIGQWVHQTLGRARYPESWLTCGASGVVGYGIAGAMAARAGFPQRPVVVISGDGSATFNLTDLERAVRQQLPFVMIVADDEAWGITVSGHRQHYGKAMSSELGPVDFAAAAEAFGAIGARVESCEELIPAVRRGVAESRPVVIHVRIPGGMPGEQGAHSEALT